MSGTGAARFALHADFCGWHEHQRDGDCSCIADRGEEICGVTLAPKGWSCSREIGHDGPCAARPLFAGATAPISDGSNYDNRGEGSGRHGNWMQTFSGRQFWPLDPRADEVFIEDIAHALSMACRYGGHCNSFYSVAEHCVHVSHVVPPEMALVGLLHDASEAYVADVIRPIKPHLTGYKAIEDRVWSVIAERFGVPVDLPPEVKLADNAVLLAECAINMKPHPAPLCVPGEPAAVTIRCWLPAEAERAFLGRFRELTA
jgi:hypothetical protein